MSGRKLSDPNTYTQCCLHRLRLYVEEEHRQLKLNRKGGWNDCGLIGSIILIFSQMFDFSCYSSLCIYLWQIQIFLTMMMNIMHNTAQPFTLHFSMYRAYLNFVHIDCVIQICSVLWWVSLKRSNNLTSCFMGQYESKLNLYELINYWAPRVVILTEILHSLRTL